METVQIRYIIEDLPRIAAAPGGDWIDLRAAEDVSMKAGEYRLIPLGIAGSSRVVNGAVNEIEVDLFQNFTALRYVTVVSNSGREEILYLENLENQNEED